MPPGDQLVVLGSGSARDRGWNRLTRIWAALRVAPGDDESSAEALRQLAEDEAERNRLFALGRERAACFHWPRTAAAYVDAYHDAVA